MQWRPRHLHWLHRWVLRQLVGHRVGPHSQEQQDRQQCERYPYQNHHRRLRYRGGRDLHQQHALERGERNRDPRRLQQVGGRLHWLCYEQGDDQGHHHQRSHWLGRHGVRHPGELQVRFGLDVLGY
ncbi:hypothetical protein PF005_g13348 [Phytophthora fragariae]|uniref:Uncharacterized protein n=1 Tax=Phytophthora fragariae TaxID=53985 RepID=A0A6A3IND0_9STRA|nr:hypothetical protein PF011_g21944 [Phytophthora fragariae]KAE9076259.1 hypothetical protein PF010_g23970 [Phytophthora fragariae]KAE9081507.1 hypothetical protein PF007_g22636 [Phytophthora fragariae]KAE9185453.1 hypothetical protein PF004_g23354 [Phytophthora fragariae]KAE9205565.1 hypothetical protein PF005_g13348 [Phytophthora fragariae]